MSDSVDAAIEMQLANAAEIAERIARCVKTGTYIAAWRNQGQFVYEIEKTSVRAGGSIPDGPYDCGEWVVVVRVGNEFVLEDHGDDRGWESLFDELCCRLRHSTLSGR